jgi:thiol-disulfide isomerase/thioredoxin
MVSLHAALAVFAFSGMGQTMLLDFYSDSCGPCRAMDPVVKQLISQGYPIKQINVQQDRATAARFRVQSIPCFVMIVNGREVDRKVGMTSAQQLMQMCRAGAPPASQAAPPPMLATAPPASAGVMPPFEAGQSCPVPPTNMPPAGGGMVPIPAIGGRPAPVANAASQPKSDAELIAVTARLRIEDAHGWSCGSGTIIDSRQGQALILTCGHVFRDSKGQGQVEVDLFGVNAAEKIPGKVIAYDLDRDVGLVSIYVPRPMVFARVAPAGLQLRGGTPVITVGCDHGNAPDVRRTVVTTVGRYSGAPNVEVADLPVVGRSGGGLFTPDGMVVGVCNAADPESREGLYASLPSVYDSFKQARIENLFQSPLGAAAETAVATAGPSVQPHQMQPTSARVPAPTPSMEEQGRLALDERAFLEEVRRRKSEGAKVICVICPAQGPSEVMALERASATLLERLNSETRVEDVRSSASTSPQNETTPPIGASIVDPGLRR